MAEKKPSLADILAKSEKKYGIKAGPMSSVSADVKSISTGNIAIDTAIGIGGLPLGRSVELYGPPSCGKTTTALQTAAELLKVIKAGGDPERGIGPNDKIAYFDYEYAMDPDYARALGFDPDDEACIFAQPDTLEEGADLMLEMIESGEIRLVIVDSVAGMVPSSIDENSVGKSLPAVQAKLLTTLGQKMNPILANNNCTIIFLNHIKEVMGIGGRPGVIQTTTPGGKAIKYFASVRLEFKQMQVFRSKFVDPVTLEEIELPTATNVKITVTKNKVGPPYRRAIARVRYGKGFDNFWTALQALTSAKKIIVGTAGMYYFHNLEQDGLVPGWMEHATTGTQRAYIKGEDNIFKMGDAHPEWREGMIDLAKTIIEERAGELIEVELAEENEGLDIEPNGDHTKRVSL